MKDSRLQKSLQQSALFSFLFFCIILTCLHGSITATQITADPNPKSHVYDRTSLSIVRALNFVFKKLQDRGMGNGVGGGNSTSPPPPPDPHSCWRFIFSNNTVYRDRHSFYCNYASSTGYSMKHKTNNFILWSTYLAGSEGSRGSSQLARSEVDFKRDEFFL